MRITLEIVTPEKSVYLDTVDEVSLPALRGYMTVLPGHTPALCALGTGVVIVRSESARDAGGRSERLVVSGGVAEISESRVILLADYARKAGEIDPAQSRTELSAAEKLLSGDAHQVREGQKQYALAIASLDAVAN